MTDARPTPAPHSEQPVLTWSAPGRYTPLMATVDHSQTRRRLATYGKPSRRRVQDYTYANQTLSPTYRSRSPSEHTKAVDGVPKSPLRGAEPAGEAVRDHSRRPPTPVRKTTPPIKSPDHRRTVTPKEHSRSRGLRPSAEKSPRPIKDDAVFDVPLSDDEAITPKSIGKRLNPQFRASKSFTNGVSSQPPSPVLRRTLSQKESFQKPLAPYSQKDQSKRRKVAKSSTHEHNAVVYDKDALQRHASRGLDHGIPFLDTTSTARSKMASLVSPGIRKGNTGQEKDAKAAQIPRSPSKQQQQQRLVHDLPSGPARLERNGVPADGLKSPPTKQLISSPKLNLRSPKAVSTMPSPLGRMARPVSPLTAGESTTVSEVRTPKRSRGTSTRSASPVDTPPSRVITTPRQARLWDELLDDESTICGDVDLDRGRQSPRRHKQDKIQPKQTDNKPRRRLIDFLGEHAVNGDVDDQMDLSGFTEGGSADQTSDITSMQAQGTKSRSARSSPQAVATNYAREPQAEIGKVPSHTQTTGPKITYTRQRSHLSENMMDEEEFLRTPIDVGSFQISQSSRRNVASGLPGSKSFSQMNDSQESTTGAIRSIHELREAGGNKRFLDESDALLEDIDDRRPTSLSRRRNALLDMAIKLCNKRFLRRFVDQSLDQKLFRDLESEKDEISSFVQAAMVVILAQEGSQSLMSSKAKKDRAVDLLTKLVKTNRNIESIVSSSASDVTKPTRYRVADLAKLLQKSAVWDTRKPDIVTPQILALRGIELLTRRSSESGETSHLLPKNTAEAIIQIIAADYVGRTNPEPPANEMISVEVALSVLGSCAVILGPTQQVSVREGFSVERSIPCLLSILSRDSADFRPLHVLVLRLLLNVTNNSQDMCEAFGTPDMISRLVQICDMEFYALSGYLEEDDRLFSLDYLILTLASLINLVEWSESARAKVLDTKADGSRLLDGILKRFVDGLGRAAEADSMEESHSNVAFGYLAVLLGTLCVDASVQQYLRSKIPGGTLRPLANAVDEFLQYHKKVDDLVYDTEGGESVQDGFTDRLQGVFNRLNGR